MVPSELSLAPAMWPFWPGSSGKLPQARSHPRGPKSFRRAGSTGFALSLRTVWICGTGRGAQSRSLLEEGETRGEVKHRCYLNICLGRGVHHTSNGLTDRLNSLYRDRGVGWGSQPLRGRGQGQVQGQLLLAPLFLSLPLMAWPVLAGLAVPTLPGPLQEALSVRESTSWGTSS